MFRNYYVIMHADILCHSQICHHECFLFAKSNLELPRNNSVFFHKIFQRRRYFIEHGCGMAPSFFACKKYIITWRWSAFTDQKRFMIMSKGTTSKMGLRTIHMILKLAVIALIIFGAFWIGMIIIYPDVEFLRNVPFGGISLLLALIIFPVYLRVRWLSTAA